MLVTDKLRALDVSKFDVAVVENMIADDDMPAAVTVMSLAALEWFVGRLDFESDRFAFVHQIGIALFTVEFVNARVVELLRKHVRDYAAECIRLYDCA